MFEIHPEWKGKRNKLVHLSDEILADFEKENKETQESETWTDADYELNEYLNGDGDIVHLYNYYDLSSNG